MTVGIRWAAGWAAITLAAAGTARAGDDHGPDMGILFPATGPTTTPALPPPTTTSLFGGPASLGQQPFSPLPPPPAPVAPPLPTEQPADQTPSQTNTNQFNQLFQFETTPDICAKGEGYLSGQGNYFDRGDSDQQVRAVVQGQYGVTDQVAVGAFVPVYYNHYPVGNRGRHETNADIGDVALYGQYKFDRLINPEIVDVTAQVDAILPTGNATQRRDTGKFGVRPLALVYKDLGKQGPGDLGLYGLMGFTITSNSDFRLGLAATYEVRRLAAVAEFTDETGTRTGRPQVVFTPGLVYRGVRAFELAAGVPVGLNNGSPNWGVTLKLTYAFQN